MALPMERVTGIGGVLLRARDPQALAAWYEEHLGIPREAIERFRAVLERARIPATVRLTRGRDIEAACGQLRLRTEREAARNAH